MSPLKARDTSEARNRRKCSLCLFVSKREKKRGKIHAFRISVQTLKEILNHTTETEILVCDMHPNRAFHKLPAEETYQPPKTRRKRGRKKKKKTIGSGSGSKDVEQIGSTNVTHNETLEMPESSNANEPSEHSSLNDNAAGLCRNLELDAGHVSLVDVANHDVISDEFESASASSMPIIRSSSGLASPSSYYSSASFDFPSSNEHHKDVSSDASDLQLSSIGNSELEVQSSEDHCALVLADHLQALADECSPLCFGTYSAGSNSAYSVILASNASTSGLEEKAAAVYGSSTQCLDASSSVNRGDEQLGFGALRETAGDKNFDLFSSHQQELDRTVLPESILGQEYNAIPSASDPIFQKSQLVTSSLPFRSRGLQNGSLFTIPGEVDTEPGNFALPHSFATPQDPVARPSTSLEQFADPRVYHPLPQNQQYTAAVNPPLAFSDSNAGYRYNQPSANKNYNLPQNRNEFLMHGLPTAGDAIGYGNHRPPFYDLGSFMSTPSLGHMPSSNFNNILPSQPYGVHGLHPLQQHASFPPFLPERTHYSPQGQGQPSQASTQQHVRPAYSELHHSQTQVVEESQRPGNFQDLTSN